MILIGCEMMNKLRDNKGFTLVELLATIVLLGIIGTISVVSIDRILDKSDITECENVLLSIKSATKEYVSDNRYGSISNPLELSKLFDDGYLTGVLTDPFTNEKVDTSRLKISISLNNDYTYKDSDLINKNNKKITCDSDIVENDSNYVLFPGY